MADNMAISRLIEEMRMLKRELHISNIMALVNNGMITKEDALRNKEFSTFVSNMRSVQSTSSNDSSDAIKANVRR